MAEAFTNALVKNITTSNTTLLTAVTAHTFVIAGLSIANTTASSITVSVFITRSAVDYYLIKDASIAPGQALIVGGADQKIVLNYSGSADVLKAISGTATSADASVSYLDIS